MTLYSVAIDTDGPRPSDQQLGELLDKLTSDGGFEGVAVSLGNQHSPGVGVQFGIEATGPEQAGAVGLSRFADAVEAITGEPPQVARLEVMTADLENRLLGAEPGGLAGVREVAAMIGVRPQRVSQLRRLPSFPRPVAELAAGPVWSIPMLKRFVASWPRKPGRPRRAPP